MCSPLQNYFRTPMADLTPTTTIDSPYAKNNALNNPPYYLPTSHSHKKSKSMTTQYSPRRPNFQHRHLHHTTTTTVDNMHDLIETSPDEDQLPKHYQQPPAITNLLVKLQQELELCRNLIGVLRQQNSNLKKQNNYVLTHLRYLSDKEKKLDQTICLRDEFIHELLVENEELRKNIQDLKLWLDGHIQERRDIRNDLHIIKEHSVSNKNSTSPRPTHNSNSNKKSYMRVEQKMSAQEQLEELNNRFEALRYSCNKQTNSRLRRETRFELLELAYRMRQLRSKHISSNATHPNYSSH